MKVAANTAERQLEFPARVPLPEVPRSCSTRGERGVAGSGAHPETGALCSAAPCRCHHRRRGGDEPFLGFRHHAHTAISSPGRVVFSRGRYQPIRPIMNDHSDLWGCTHGTWGISWACPEHFPAPPLFQTASVLPNIPRIRPVLQDRVSLGKTTSGCRRGDAPHGTMEVE